MPARRKFLRNCALVPTVLITMGMLSGPAAADKLVTGDNNGMVLHLGKIDVQGKHTVIRELQAIKLALQQHFSNDPKLADVVVCTLETQAGSHIMKRLSCATNRSWIRQRDGVQADMTYAQQSTNVKEGLPHNRLGSEDTTGCTTSSCYDRMLSPMDETLGLLPGHYLQVTVDGATLQTLLSKIQDPRQPAAKSETHTGG
ncbi:MAG: hypothetical protein KGK44_05570 [Gammaproteobacteria bacterium]|nr:hypothetical protein [Gammaproteobacteria bacterium]